MAKGVKTFWKSAPQAPQQEEKNQILKNECYINFKLECASYKSVGNFWQKTFGGSDDIALTTSLTYKNGNEVIEATTVINRKQVKVKQTSNLATKRIIGEKIPAIADSISMEFRMTALNNDKLQKKFDMLNKPEYQAALQLAPKAVGQVVTITSLVKGLLTDTDPQHQIEASFAGIISVEKEREPIKNGKLTKGMLIFINTDTGAEFNDVDDTKFQVKNGALYYDTKEVENTYAIFVISTDDVRGADQSSTWFKKYSSAIRNLEKLRNVNNQTDQETIYKETLVIWNEGNALLYDDINYIESERIKISNKAMADINSKYETLTNSNKIIPKELHATILTGLTGNTVYNEVVNALPATGELLNEQLQVDPTKPISTDVLEKLSLTSEKLRDIIVNDNNVYAAELGANDLTWTWQ